MSEVENKNGTEVVNATAEVPATKTDDGIDYAKKLYENSQKTLKLQRIATCCTAGIFAVILIASLVVVPKAVKTLVTINDVAEQAKTVIDDSSTTLNDVSDMAKSLEKAGNKMEQVIVDNETSLVDAMDKISKIDFDGLNQGIKDLQDAVGPFASFMKKFK